MFLGAGWTLVRAQAALGEGLGKVRQGFLSNLITAYMYALLEASCGYQRCALSGARRGFL